MHAVAIMAWWYLAPGSGSRASVAAAHALAPLVLPGRAAPALAALARWGEEAAQASAAPARWGALAARALAAPGRRGEEAARASAALERRGVPVPQAWAVQARQLGEEEAAWAWATPASARVPQAWAAQWGEGAALGVLAPRVSVTPRVLSIKNLTYHHMHCKELVILQTLICIY